MTAFSVVGERRDGGDDTTGDRRTDVDDAIEAGDVCGRGGHEEGSEYAALVSTLSGLASGDV